MNRLPGVTFNSCTTGSTALGHLRNLTIHRVIVEDTVIDRCKGCVVSAVVVVVQLHDQVVVIVGRWIRSVICSRRWWKRSSPEEPKHKSFDGHGPHCQRRRRGDVGAMG
jgi:hypothetical protein